MKVMADSDGLAEMWWGRVGICCLLEWVHPNGCCLACCTACACACAAVRTSKAAARGRCPACLRHGRTPAPQLATYWLECGENEQGMEQCDCI